MTDIKAGIKRNHDGEDDYARKRHRDHPSPKDWRDVHLDSPRHSSRRPASKSHGDKDYRRSSHSDYRRGDSNDYRRGDSNDHRRNRHHRDERPSSRSRHGEQRNGRKSPRPAAAPDSEKEEGEISPQPSLTHSRHSSPRPSEISTQAAPEEKEPPIEPLADLELEAPVQSVEDSLAARRAKRQAILAKYKEQQQPNSAATLPPDNPVVSDAPPVSEPQSTNNDPKEITDTTDRSSTTPQPAEFELEKAGDDEANQASLTQENGGNEQISAADYDPSLDRREDEQKRFHDPEPMNVVEEEVEEVYEEVEEEEVVEDMFAAEPIVRKVRKTRRVAKTIAPALVTATLDSAADPEGYYTVILGEQLDRGRYQVFSSIGKGMFANVVRARKLQGDSSELGKEVAIKIIRCQESMMRAGQKEVQILNRLKQADPEDKKHLIRLERVFEHRGHLCLVFEPMSMNLRDVVKRFGKDVGLNIRAVRAYAHQLFLSLSLLRKANIMHADIKPDNILVNESKTVLKLCDLGSASDASENDITPYLVSRFYRAPEIILGVPYDPALDIWSVGCTLYELYTGKILFPGRSNNQMLLLMMELKGRFNTKMIKKAQFGDLYFDEMGNFQSLEKDRVTGSDTVRQVHVSKANRDLRTRLMHGSSKMTTEESNTLLSLIDLLDKCLALDPARRITPREALLHPFIRG